jgi:sec-independent protein translocase protein TatC
MADTDTVLGAGLPDRLPAPGAPAGPAQPAAEPDKVMTLVDHLTELRTRIVRSIIAVAVGTAVGFYFAKPLRDMLMLPLPADHRKLQVLSPGDGFAIALQIAVITGVILAMPVLLYQLWAFVAPGLTPSERRALRPWIPLALLFFAIGVTIAFVILPFAIQFLLAFTDETLVANLAAPNYFGFVTTMFLAFGLLMEFPIVLYGLARVGILSSARLTSSRRIVIPSLFAFAAVATPGGDLVSPTILWITMVILFQLTIIAIRRGGR